MPRIQSTYTRSFRTRATPDQVKDLLSNPDTWCRHQGEILQATVVDAHTIDVVLQKHTHGPATFQGRYRCRWSRTEDGTRWDSDPGSNFDLHGKVSVRASQGGSEVTWTEQVDADVPMPRLMVRVVRPIAKTLMAKGMDRFCKLMQQHLDALA